MPSYYIKHSNAFRDQVKMGIYFRVATEESNLFREMGEKREFRGTWNIKNRCCFFSFYLCKTWNKPIYFRVSRNMIAHLGEPRL